MLNKSLKDQVKSADNNFFVSKEIYDRLDIEDVKTNTLVFKIFSKKDIFEFNLEKFKNKKDSYLIAFEVSKQDLSKYLSAKVEKISLLLKDVVLFSLDTKDLLLEYGIVKKDINRYMLKIKIQKESLKWTLNLTNL